MKKLSSPLAEFLYSHYEIRKNRNPAYSLRAYSRDLGISSGRLCEILYEKRMLRLATAERISKALDLDVEQNAVFFNLNRKKEQPTSILTEQQLAVLTQWEFNAVLCLMEMKHFSSNHQWIASRIGVMKERIDSVMKTLMDLNLVLFNDEVYTLNIQNGSTADNISSEALRKFHSEMITHSLTKIHSVPLELRDFSGITITANMKNLPKAKKLIKQFRRRMAKLLEFGKKTEVYQCNIQLFPLSDISKD